MAAPSLRDYFGEQRERLESAVQQAVQKACHQRSGDVVRAVGQFLLSDAQEFQDLVAANEHLTKQVEEQAAEIARLKAAQSESAGVAAEVTGASPKDGGSGVAARAEAPPPIGEARQGTGPSPQAQTLEPKPNSGHVFVLNCDARGLAADTILVPLRDESASSIEVGTVNALTKDEAEKEGYVGVTCVYEGQITTRLYDTEEDAIKGTMAVVNNYLKEAASVLKGTRSGFRRAKPLLALPMPGVGKMDEKNLVQEMGNIISPLLPNLYMTAQEYEVDVALCTIDSGAFNVAQVLRERCCPFKGGPFWMLSPELRAEASRLQSAAISGRLGILFGAGVSFPSGLPSWGGLLEKLASVAGFDDESKAALSELGFLDQPTLIEEKMGDSAAFKQAIADAVKSGRYTPAHSIMGSLALPAITTNYDPLYENAVASAAEEEEDFVQRLPWDVVKLVNMPSNVRRVLKLHGCVSDPNSIVLTRADYMRYEDERRALRGLLHQNLLENELLVLGFSMTDDNVHLIIDQVRKTLAGKIPGKSFIMGSVVALVENRMFRKLWEKDFNVITCGNSWADNPAWIHDCFLDCITTGVVLQHAAASFVLHPAYSSLLNEMQCKIKAALQPVQDLLHDESVKMYPSWKRIEAMLKEFGAEELNKAVDERYRLKREATRRNSAQGLAVVRADDVAN